MMENSLERTNMITKVKKGEVWIAYDDKSSKKRPFVIMSDELSGIDIDVVATPTTTSNVRNKYDVIIEFWKESGLNRPSIARCSKIHAFNYLQLIRKLGNLRKSDLDKINEATKKFLGL